MIGRGLLAATLHLGCATRVDPEPRLLSTAEAHVVEAAPTEVASDLPFLPPEASAQEKESLRNPKVILGLQVILARLGFFTRPFNGKLDSRTVNALKKYKQEAGLPEGNSVWDAPLSKRVNHDVDALAEPVGLPHFYISDDYGGYLSATGTWVGVGQPTASPQQTSEIKCRQDLGVCFEALAKLTDSSSLFGQAYIYEIQSWTSEAIVFFERASCATITTRINLVTKTVARTRSTTRQDGLCETVGKEDWHLKLADGWEVSKELRRDWYAGIAEVLGINEALLDEGRGQ